MGSGGGSTKTTTQQKLSPEQRQLLAGVIPVAQQYVSPTGQVNAPVYQGPTVAPVTPLQTLGQQMVVQGAGGQQQVANTAAGGLGFLTGGNVLYPGSNPALEQAINAAVRPITENYEQNVLGNIRDTSQLAGMYGYNRQGLQEAAAARDYMNAIGGTAASMANTNYQAGLDAMTKAMAFEPGVQASLTAPGVSVAGVGQQQQQQQQALIDAQVQKFYQEQYLPFELAQQVAAMAFGIPAGSTTTQGSGGGASPAQMAIGGGSIAASLASALLPLLALGGT